MEFFDDLKLWNQPMQNALPNVKPDLYGNGMPFFISERFPKPCGWEFINLDVWEKVGVVLVSKL